MSNNIDSTDQEAIIRAWEETHHPNTHKSRLVQYDTLIREKIEAGYTQQAVAELLTSLGCSTTHQNLSRYLKKHMPSRNSTRKEGGTFTSSSKSDLGALQKHLQTRDRSS